MSAPSPEREVCRGCGEEIDPGVGWCGMSPDDHNPYYDGHTPVPMGCQCGRTRQDAALEVPDTKGPYEARFVDRGMPSDCCEYSVISLSEGREVCRVWREQDARAIASALSALAKAEGRS